MKCSIYIKLYPTYTSCVFVSLKRYDVHLTDPVLILVNAFLVQNIESAAISHARQGFQSNYGIVVVHSISLIATHFNSLK